MKLVVLKIKFVKYIAGLAMALSVIACATIGNISKNRFIQTESQIIETANPAYKVEKLNVTVPTEFTVSEANVFLPMSDIVWREDPLGNRKQQVQTILINAIGKGAAKVETGSPVTMEVRLNKFHAVTEKARYTVGRHHNINFDYLLRDARTGVPVVEVQNVALKF